MALIIKGDMPKGCGLCWECLGGSDAYYCNRTKRQISEVIPPYDKRMEWCPILCEIPDKHGRLKDESVIIQKAEDAFCKLFPFDGKNKQKIASEFYKALLKAIFEAPVVVEATE